ncbi:MAG: FAD-dependent oxidoreductase [Archaeoglobaceae archaeon]|nr:FAD-dependent oxidoreductase [Archaeoglobaceae archaeon]
MKIAIIGAGLTGLSAAMSLKEHAEVKVFEKDDIGGLASSYCKNNYCIEKFYHHCFKQDEELLKLSNKLLLSSIQASLLLLLACLFLRLIRSRELCFLRGIVFLS